MPNHKSAAKRARQAIVRRQRNRQHRSAMRTQIRDTRAAFQAGDVQTAERELREAVSVIQSMVSKGQIHKNQGNRRVSRLQKAFNALQSHVTE